VRTACGKSAVTRWLSRLLSVAAARTARRDPGGSSRSRGRRNALPSGGIVDIDKPVVRARYEFSEWSEPELSSLIDAFLQERRLGA